MADEMTLMLDGCHVAMRYPFHLPQEDKDPTREAYQNHVDRLCVELQAVLLEEAVAGNWVSQVWGGWPQTDSIGILLGTPFRRLHDSLPAGLKLSHINDPHYWKSEIFCERTHHMIACAFGLHGQSS